MAGIRSLGVIVLLPLNRFDAVLVWKIDRFGRSLKHLVNALAELDALGVAFISQVIVEHIPHESESLRVREVLDYTLQERGPMLC